MALADVLHLPEHRGAQLEDGYMRVANELGRAITWARLTAYQRCILDVVMRQTYGFNKSVDEIARTQFADETGIDPSDVRRTINELVAMNIITRADGRFAHAYSINKRHATWNVSEERKLINKPGFKGGIPLPSGGDSPENEEGIPPEEGGDSPPTKDIPKRHSQKTTPKENLSRSLRERFEIFWECYPRKRSKKAAEKAFAKVNPDEQLYVQFCFARIHSREIRRQCPRVPIHGHLNRIGSIRVPCMRRGLLAVLLGHDHVRVNPSCRRLRRRAVPHRSAQPHRSTFERRVVLAQIAPVPHGRQRHLHFQAHASSVDPIFRARTGSHSANARSHTSNLTCFGVPTRF